MEDKIPLGSVGITLKCRVCGEGVSIDDKWDDAHRVLCINGHDIGDWGTLKQAAVEGALQEFLDSAEKAGRKKIIL